MAIDTIIQIAVFLLTLSAGVVTVGRYTGKIEAKLENIEAAVQEVKETTDDISIRVEKVENKISVLTERVGALEQYQNGNYKNGNSKN